MSPKKTSAASKKKRILETFLEITKNPESYLSLQPKRIDKTKLLLKNIYDYGVACYHGKPNGDILQELELGNVDEEQIWQQLELRNNAIWKDLLEESAKLLSLKKENFLIDSHVAASETEDDEVVEEDKAETGKSNKKFPKNVKNKDIKRKMKKSSVVDDNFFNLCEMNAYLDMEDKKEADGKENSSDEDADYFYHSSDDENLQYKDFFESTEESIEEENTGKKNKSQNTNEDENELGDDYDDVNIKNNDDSDEVTDDDVNEDVNDKSEDSPYINKNFDEDGDEVDDAQNNKISSKEKSSFEEREERLRSRIQQYEENALSEKPWQLKGEIVANSRPQNSLLEEILEFEATTRPAPVITEETTMRLEDIIRRRIKDKAWDDVEKKIKLIQTDHEFKKQLILDQEKSKESLAQIYEKEYRNQIEKLEENNDSSKTESKEHQEIKNLMKSLFIKLDALSNFHYTPKPAIPEIKIITNIPAVNMEEVAPVAVSDATLLAPEEVRKHVKGELIGKSERTRSDKNRDRRNIKLKQKFKKKLNEERELQKQQKGIQSKKGERDMLLKSVTKNRNVKKMEINTDEKVPKSSTAFFNQLQDKIASDKKKGKNQPRKDISGISAKKLKL